MLRLIIAMAVVAALLIALGVGLAIGRVIRMRDAQTPRKDTEP